MTAVKPEWRVEAVLSENLGTISRDYPLATLGGAHALHQLLVASDIWRALTRAQRELLLSTAAGAPIRARRDVRQRLYDRGLISHPSCAGGVPELTEAGRLLIAWRPR